MNDNQNDAFNTSKGFSISTVSITNNKTSTAKKRRQLSFNRITNTNINRARVVGTAKPAIAQ
jgi:hypothetical protein